MVYRNMIWFAKGLREYTRNGFLSASANFDPHELEHVRLDNRIVVITGANSGIGLACCKALVKHGAQLHMVCRNAERGQKALEDICTEAGGDSRSRVILHQLDLSQPKKTREFAKQFSKQHDHVDILINNAGCMVNTLTFNEDNIEMNFATNTLGTYILTETLIPSLEKSSDPRVITVSSGGMLVQRLDHEDPMLELKRDKFDGTMVYAQQKRQQVVLTELWAKSHPAIHFSVMHPGWADTPAVASSMPSFHRRMEGRLRTPEQGADTAIWLALTPNIKSLGNGLFFQDRKVVPQHLPLARTHASPEEKQAFLNGLVAIAKPFMTSDTAQS